MTASLYTSVLLGLDGFAVCLALGPFGIGIARGAALAGLFGLCDGLALLAGDAISPFLSGNVVASALLPGLWLVVVTGLVVSNARRLLPLLPVLLCLDNLLAGSAGNHATPEDAFLSFVVSTALAGAGLSGGRALSVWLQLDPGKARLAGSALLLGVGLASIVG
jgi:hypothetical protein